MFRFAQLTALLVVCAVALSGCAAEDKGADAPPRSSEFNGTTIFNLPDAKKQKLPAYGPGVKGDVLPLRPKNGKLLLVFFGFTSCPDICPTTMGATGAAVRLLPKDEQKQIEGSMISVDPARDSGAKLQKYVAQFFNAQRAWGFRTDDMDALAQVERAFGAASEIEGEGGHDHSAHEESTTPKGENYDVNHSTLRYAVNEDGEVVLMWQEAVTSEEVAEDLRKLLAQANGEDSAPTK